MSIVIWISTRWTDTLLTRWRITETIPSDELPEEASFLFLISHSLSRSLSPSLSLSLFHIRSHSSLLRHRPSNGDTVSISF
ncbi:hypothetical protein RIF29_24846 [Crotalaria pallida]|uniref:Uncharacterized protein n=1 Tax=Crotalaria pallida TaxID=3830 RepID=A0AAN9EKI2_CROPI